MEYRRFLPPHYPLRPRRTNDHKNGLEQEEKGDEKVPPEKQWHARIQEPFLFVSFRLSLLLPFPLRLPPLARASAVGKEIFCEIGGKNRDCWLLLEGGKIRWGEGKYYSALPLPPRHSPSIALGSCQDIRRPLCAGLWLWFIAARRGSTEESWGGGKSREGEASVLSRLAKKEILDRFVARVLRLTLLTPGTMEC